MGPLDVRSTTLHGACTHHTVGGRAAGGGNACVHGAARAGRAAQYCAPPAPGATVLSNAGCVVRACAVCACVRMHACAAARASCKTLPWPAPSAPQTGAPTSAAALQGGAVQSAWGVVQERRVGAGRGCGQSVRPTFERALAEQALAAQQPLVVQAQRGAEHVPAQRARCMCWLRAWHAGPRPQAARARTMPVSGCRF